MGRRPALSTVKTTLGKNWYSQDSFWGKIYFRKNYNFTTNIGLRAKKSRQGYQNGILRFQRNIWGKLIFFEKKAFSVIISGLWVKFFWTFFMQDCQNFNLRAKRDINEVLFVKCYDEKTKIWSVSCKQPAVAELSTKICWHYVTFFCIFEMRPKKLR